MSVVKTALVASAILATLGLAGCQTTEDRVYYGGVRQPPRTTVIYDDGPRWVAPPPRVYVRSAPIIIDRPDYRQRHWPPPHRWGGPTPDPNDRWGGPTPDPRHRWGGPTPDPRQRWRDPPRGRDGSVPGWQGGGGRNGRDRGGVGGFVPPQETDGRN